MSHTILLLPAFIQGPNEYLGSVNPDIAYPVNKCDNTNFEVIENFLIKNPRTNDRTINDEIDIKKLTIRYYGNFSEDKNYQKRDWLVIIQTTKPYDEIHIGNLTIRYYRNFSEDDNYRNSFDDIINSEKAWLVIIQTNEVASIKKYVEGICGRKVFWTNWGDNDGFVSFMPIETFRKTEWIIGPKKYQKPPVKSIDELKSDILDVYFNEQFKDEIRKRSGTTMVDKDDDKKTLAEILLDKKVISKNNTKFSIAKQFEALCKAAEFEPLSDKLNELLKPPPETNEEKKARRKEIVDAEIKRKKEQKRKKEERIDKRNISIEDDAIAENFLIIRNRLSEEETARLAARKKLKENFNKAKEHLKECGEAWKKFDELLPKPACIPQLLPHIKQVADSCRLEYEVLKAVWEQKLYDEDLKHFKENYRKKCKNKLLDSATYRLIVPSADSYSQEIEKIEIERTFHRGKLNHYGLDLISKLMLKQFIKSDTSNANSLINFCNNMFALFDIPDDVKSTALRFKMDKFNAEKMSYGFRPIAMATLLFNIIDKVILYRLNNYNWSRPEELLPENSFSYQKRKSAPLCRNNVLMHVADLISRKQCWHAISFDFVQAYERVDPLMLCQRMIENKIPPKIVSWVWFCLRRRQLTLEQRSEHENQTIDEQRLYRSYGVPQGSALSPILFNIYMAHIHKLVNSDVKIYQYTDDVLILGSGETIEKAKEITEKNAHKIIDDLKNYNMKLKKKNDDYIEFVGLKMKNPTERDHCKNLEYIFESFFDDMKDIISKRITEISVTTNPANNFNIYHNFSLYHTQIRPLLVKVYLSAFILDPEKVDVFIQKRIKCIHEEDHVRILRKCLRLAETENNIENNNETENNIENNNETENNIENLMILYECGEFDLEEMQEKEWYNEFVRYVYYGLMSKNVSPLAKNMTHIEAVQRNEHYPGNLKVILSESVRKGKKNNENYEYADYDCVVYTDGSNRENFTGIGIHFKKPSKTKSGGSPELDDTSFQLNSNLGIESAEIIAILKAIEIIERNGLVSTSDRLLRIITLTDRQSTCLLLDESSKTRNLHYYAEQIKAKLIQNPKIELTIKWVKKNSEKGNKSADRLATQAETMDRAFTSLSLKDAINLNDHKLRDKMTAKSTNFNSTNYFQIIDGKFRIVPWFKTKTIRALGLSDNTILKYIKARLQSNERSDWETLKNWKYYHSNYFCINKNCIEVGEGVADERYCLEHGE